MKEQFVTYEIALGLKELGFDEPCFGYYTPMKEWMMAGTRINPERHFHGCNWANSDNSMYFMYKQNSFGDRDSVVKNSEFTKAIHNVTVPLWQQVIDWFLKKKHLYIDITFKEVKGPKIEGINSVYFDIEIYSIFGGDAWKKYRFSEISDDYYYAREQAILKAIELCKE